MVNHTDNDRWQFFIDRGGTFTDIVARRPDGSLLVHKLLSENPERYLDATVQGIRDVVGIPKDAELPPDSIAVVKMGTTVATNALLERKGARTLLVTTKGFGDALRIGYQNRPKIFAQQIVLPEMLYEQVCEVDERLNAEGKTIAGLDLNKARVSLQKAYDTGIRAVAIILMHGYRYPKHELMLGDLCKEIGFTQISLSHTVSPLIKLVSRGDTTVVDAYLSPILEKYVNQVSSNLGDTKLMFMQSHGGLADALAFHGKDSILSGPAGGIVGAVQTAKQAGFEKLITFDMGGTSTDVSHFDGTYERQFETEVAGVRLRTPMLSIHTVAAGGGSIVHFDGQRYRVGPDSAGANPGPACYRKDGPLTITDCNLMVGKLQPQFFPALFGESGNMPLDAHVVHQKFSQLASQLTKVTGNQRSAHEVADGFITIAVDNMANAIKKISIQRGYDVSQYTLCCFGGAAGQHACKIADSLGMEQIFIHPLAGVLSAYGMGLAEQRVMKEQSVDLPIQEDHVDEIKRILAALSQHAHTELTNQEIATSAITIFPRALLRYHGTDSSLLVDFNSVDSMHASFNELHMKRYGFIAEEKQLVVDALSVEAVAEGIHVIDSTNISNWHSTNKSHDDSKQSMDSVRMYTNGTWNDTPVYQRESLDKSITIKAPAIIIDATGTNVVEPGWEARINDNNGLILTKTASASGSASISNQAESSPDPVKLEIFNNLFMSVAEQMGVTLQNTSYSVNIKERLDFSCAIFDRDGNLIANAPHIPVHLGSMGESVRTIITNRHNNIHAGDVYVLNNPYDGGTHLPDITVITPVFDREGKAISFFVASRAHHADIGGITPGSMPPTSRTIDEEGVLIDDFLLVEKGKFREAEFLELLSSAAFPARNPVQNLADIRAQIAANQCGVLELNKLIKHWGQETVNSYMQHVQNNAEFCIRKAIASLRSGSFNYMLDDGSNISVKVTIDAKSRSATIDFTGTSPQQDGNFNAPAAVCKAAVLYVFRTLINEDIPLNAGCLRPLEIIIPKGSLLNPQYPAAVVAGNVETSQVVTDAIFGALGVQAAAQGTMNNFTFGDDKHQYYETICGGSGAGASYHGTDAVHTHMTNSRLTDPEVLEWRYPVLLDQFSIRKDSGGKGRYHGGNGVIRRITFLKPMTAAILSNRRIVPPFGLAGGEAGKKGRNYIERASGKTEELAGTAIVNMNPGDAFVIETPGGGGFGHQP
jgi:5-oxoprolinase (ATP-hydrolysing)